MNKLSFASVIIPCRNEEKFIGKCLDSILANDFPRDRLEILIIDGMSDDGTREIVLSYSKKHPYIKLIDNPEMATTYGLNRGILEAKGDVIVRIDAHCYIEPDYIQECFATLMRTGADNVGGLMRPVATNFVGKCIALAMGSPFGVGGGMFHYAEEEMFVDTVYLGAFRREIFEKVGLYDEKLHYSEDDELNYRIIKSGGKIFLNYKIKSHYYCRSSLRSLWRQFYNYGYGKTRTLMKHKSLKSYRHFIPAVFILSLVGSLALSIVDPSFVYLLLLVLGSYVGASFFVALRKGLKYSFMLPIVFGIMHFSYGSGLLYGITNIIIFEKVLKCFKK